MSMEASYCQQGRGFTGRIAGHPPIIKRSSSNHQGRAEPDARHSAEVREDVMTERYDAKSALDELNEDAVLPHPVRLRDMILRIRFGANDALEINREFQEYLAAFGQTQKIAHEILEKLANGDPKMS